MYVWMDDILIYFKTVEEHREHLKKMLNILRSNKFYAKRSTCEFFPSNVYYHVHIVTDEGILIDLRKIKVTIEWVIPRDTTKVQTFLGLASNYWRFVKGFIKIAISLIALLKGTFGSVN